MQSNYKRFHSVFQDLLSSRPAFPQNVKENKLNYELFCDKRNTLVSVYILRPCGFRFEGCWMRSISQPTCELPFLCLLTLKAFSVWPTR